MTQRERLSYDHRIKAQVAAAGDPNLFPDREIRLSKAVGWIRRGVGEVVALEPAIEAETHLMNVSPSWNIACRCSRRCFG